MNILIYTLKSIAFALTEPYFVVLLLIISIMLYRKNRKIVLMQKMIIGERITSPFELTISQIVIGIFAGTFASIMLSYLGVAFDKDSSIDFLFLASLIFMLWKPKFICFSYSGAVLGIMSIILSQFEKIFNIPNLNFLKIDIVSIMMLVAVLHFIEGILIIIDGRKGAIPVYSNKDNKIIGGFAMQRYWVIPVTLFIIIGTKGNVTDFTFQVSTPNWWPLVKTSIPLDILKKGILALIPFYGILGYNSVTFTKSKKEKNLISGFLTIFYSIILFALAQVAYINIFYKILVLCFCFLGHEGMIRFQVFMENKGKPKYISNDNGIMVLDVAPNSPANEMGIKSGDLLVEVNNKKINDEGDIFKTIKEASNFIWFKVKRVTGNFEELTYNKMNNNKSFGIVFVPKNMPKDSTVIKLKEQRFKEVLDKIKNKNKHK